MAVLAELEAYDRFWEETVARHFRPEQILTGFLHPNQLLILEALARLGMPVSAGIMEEICDGEIDKKLFSYHLRRLKGKGILEVTETKKRRGTLEKFFDVRSVEGEDEDDG